MKVITYTMNRSDFAGLAPVIHCLRDVSGCNLITIAGGMHLSPRHGEPLRLLKDKGITPNYVLDSLRRSTDDAEEIAVEFGGLVTSLREILVKEKPDRIFILGDRYELLPLASLALILGIPLVHHSGGDITNGSLDNQVRYALTSPSRRTSTTCKELGSNWRRVLEDSCDGRTGIDGLKLLRN
jgi:UDP-N-acetylglucosamine 2-epimerase